mmetsp:Transcript_13598/g.58070  ORF Transcript_13598/g.58070 Transcript_13598/m.58070 type:complete len:161 (+) Transcript_13598:79-561(+)
MESQSARPEGRLRSFFGRDSFDPLLTIGQMITMQCLFYLSLALTLEVLVGSERLTVRSFFDSSLITTSTTEGWRFISAFACAAVLDACFLCVVVGRAKKCLDFAATTYLVHFASCCAVAGVPKGAGWWVTTGVALSVTAIIGEYLCVSRELRDIPVAGGR